MNKQGIKDILMDYMSNLTIIDTHEHFSQEKTHMKNDYNFYYLFMPYIQYDLLGAGMPKKWIWRAPQSDREIDKYWKVISPLWKYVKNGSYARPLLRAMKKFWNIEDITDENYREVGNIMNGTRKEGYYNDILMKECNIKYILNQIGLADTGYDYMKGAFQGSEHGRYGELTKYLDSQSGNVTIDDYCEYVIQKLKTAVKEGAVLSKYDVACLRGIPDRDKASEEFESLKKNRNMYYFPEIEYYVVNETLKVIPQLDIVAAIHSGVWGDLNNQDPVHLFPIMEKYPDVTFDIYHMGMPFVRKCAFLGKNYHNAYLNLCWSHIVSSEMTIAGITEWLDVVPVNKIFGFGGDYCTNPENIWGHLMIARENFAVVFAEKIIKGHMDMDDAKFIIRSWMYDNPARVYKLDRND